MSSPELWETHWKHLMKLWICIFRNHIQLTIHPIQSNPFRFFKMFQNSPSPSSSSTACTEFTSLSWISDQYSCCFQFNCNQKFALTLWASTIDSKSVWFYGRNEVTSRERNYCSKHPSKKLRVLEVWSTSLFESTELDPNLSLLAIASSMTGLCRLFPSVMKKMWSWPPTTCYLLHLHHHNNFLLATRRCSSSDLALEWTACSVKNPNSCTISTNEWHWITSQLLVRFCQICLLTRLHSSRKCPAVLVSMVGNLVRICRRTCVGPEFVPALRRQLVKNVSLHCKHLDNVDQSYQMLMAQLEVWPFSIFFIYFHVFHGPNMTRLSSRKRVHSFWCSLCWLGISEMLVNIWRQGQTADQQAICRHKT